MKRAFLLVLLLGTGTAPADVLHLVDGGVLEGRVSRTEAGFQVLLPSGATVSVPKERVASVERKPDAVETYLERRKALQSGDLPGILDLADWAAGQPGLDKAVRKLAREALVIDPASERAHILLGESRVGGVWLTGEKARRQGYCRLVRGWGDWDAKWAEDETLLSLAPAFLAKARAALASGTLQSMDLPSRVWTVLLHRAVPPSGPVAAGLMELTEGEGGAVQALAEIPEGVSGEVPCILLLPGGEGPAKAMDRWREAAGSSGAVLLCPADGGQWEAALALLRARGVLPDPNRIILAGWGGGADQALPLLERRPDAFSAAIVISGAAEVLDVPAIANAADLPLFLFEDPASVKVMHRLRNVSGAVQLGGGQAPLQTLTPDTAALSLREALACRRVPWPQRLRRALKPGDHHAWIRCGEAKAGSWVEARISPRNTIYLAGQGLERLTLDLSDDLLDLSKPVTVIGNGRTLFQGVVKADLDAALARLAKGGDRHRIVTAEVEVVFPKD